MKSVEEQFELVSRGTDQIEPREELRKKLLKSVESGRPLRIKYGIDPEVFNNLCHRQDGVAISPDAY